MLNFCVSILIATFLLLFPHGADTVFVQRPCRCVFFPSFFSLFYFNSTKQISPFLCRASLCVHVWIFSQIIPEWLKGGGVGWVFVIWWWGSRKSPPARSVASLLPFCRLDHILVMGRTINGHASTPKAAPTLLSHLLFFSFQWIQMDLYLAMYWWKSLLICWPLFLPLQANDRVVYLLQFVLQFGIYNLLCCRRRHANECW